MELLSYKTKPRRKILKTALRLGATSIAFCAHIDVATEVPGAAKSNFSPFRGGDFARVKPAYWKSLTDTVDRINDSGAVAVVYGLMFPGIRRGFTFEDFKFQGRRIPLSDWQRYTGSARAGWESYWGEVNYRLGHNHNKVVYVDGVEPYTNQLEHPPNIYTRSMELISPWAYRAGDGGEIHSDPGRTLAPLTNEPVLAYDGWGNSTRIWTVDVLNADGTATRRKLRFAGLPEVFRADGTLFPVGRGSDKAAAKAVGRWFRSEYRRQESRRDFFLWLHTPGWGAYNYSSARDVSLQRPGVVGFPKPFDTVLRTLRKEATRA